MRTRAAASVHDWTHMTIAERDAWTSAGNLPPLAGGEPTRREQLETAARSALTALEAAQRAIDEPAEDADLDELERAFNDANDAHQHALRALDRHTEIEEARRRTPAAPAENDEERGGGGGGDARVTRNEEIYRPDRNDSLLLDLAVRQSPVVAQELGRSQEDAGERLRRNAGMVADDLARIQRNEPGRMRELRDAGLVVHTDTEQRAIGTTDGGIGEFAPPLWMIDMYAPLARSGRPITDLVGPLPLPQGAGSIEIPKITGGTSVDYQTTEGTDVSETDMTSSSVSSEIATLAGSQTVALQLLAQSPVSPDAWLLPDLFGALNEKTEAEVVNGQGNGSNKKLRGILRISGHNAITWTTSTPTIGALYSKGAYALSQVEENAKAAPGVFVMAPRRWYWGIAQVDSQGRPVMVPDTEAAVNAMGQAQSFTEGYKGRFVGQPTYTSAGVPTTNGSGTNEDVMASIRPQDILYWESAPQVLVSEHFKASKLQLFFRLHRFAALIPDRQPKGQSRVTGNGLSTPSF